MSDAWERAVQALGQARHWGGRLQSAHADLDARERKIAILVAQVERRLGHPVEGGFTSGTPEDPGALVTALERMLDDAVALDEAIVARDHLADVLGRAAVSDELRRWQRGAATSLGRAEAALLEGSSAGIAEARTIFAAQAASLEALEAATHAAAQEAHSAAEAAEASFAEVGEIVEDEIKRLAQAIARLLRGRSGVDTAGAIGLVLAAVAGGGLGGAVGRTLGESPGPMGAGGAGLAIGLVLALLLWAVRSRPFAAELGVHATRAAELVEEVRHARTEVAAELARIGQAAATTRLTALDLGLSAELPDVDHARKRVEAAGPEAEAVALGEQIAAAGRWSANLKVGGLVAVVVAGLGLGALAATMGPAASDQEEVATERGSDAAERGPVAAESSREPGAGGEASAAPGGEPTAIPGGEAPAIPGAEAPAVPGEPSEASGASGAPGGAPAAVRADEPPAPPRSAEPVWPFLAGPWKGTYGLGELKGTLDLKGASVRGTLTMTEGGTSEACAASGMIGSGGKLTLKLSGCAAAGTIKAKLAPDGSAIIGSGARKTPMGTVTDNLTMTAG